MKGCDDMTIQIATLKDLASICSLYQVLFANMALLQPEYFKESPVGEAFPKSTIESDKGDIIIAVENEVVVGFSHVNEQETPPYGCLVPHKYALLIDLVVDPSYREKGIGTTLIDATKQWAKLRGLDYLELCVLFENKDAARLYERENFKTVMHKMRYKL